MKNQKLKNLLKIGILIFGISLLITNCQKDDVKTEDTQEIEQPKNTISINYVQGEDIPNIVNLLNPDYSTSSKSNSAKSSTVSATFGSISIEDILLIIDTLGNKNYSFSLIPKTSKPNSIFNLVINNTNGNNNMAILEYRMAPDFAKAYYDGTKTMAEFTGSVLTFPFNAAASNIFSKSSGNTCVQNIDEIVNCDQIDVDSGTIVSSGGSGNSGATGIGDTYTYTGGNGGDVTHNYGGGSTGVSSGGGSGTDQCVDIVWESGGVTYWTTVPCKKAVSSHSNRNNNPKSKSSTTSCCDNTNLDGSIGLNEARSKKINIITGALKLLSDSAETQWLNNNASNEELTSLSQFLLENKRNVEAKEFANQTIDALMVGQKFDFTESFKSPFNVDLSGVKPDADPNTTERDKEVFMNVYNKLIETAEFKKLFLDVFGQDSRFTIKFKIQDNLQCGDAENPNGCTTAIIESVDGKPTSIKNNLITISIDKTHLETSSFIDIAKTIIHEAIHANLTLLQVKDKSLALPLVYSHSADTFAYILKERFNNDDHIFMANYYIPTMSAILKSVMPLLYSPERIQQILDRTIIDLTGSGLGELEKFNFAHFYEYYPWSGLHKTSEFTANFVIQRDYALYIGYILIAREFGH